jgi:PAS domain S-box-containing protein
VSSRRRVGSELFSPPPFEEDDARRKSGVLQTVLAVQALAITSYAVWLGATQTLHGAELPVIAAFVGLMVVAIGLVRVGALLPAGGLAVTTQLLFSLAGAAVNVNAGGTAGLFVAVMLAGEFFGAVGAVVTGGTALCALGAIGLLDQDVVMAFSTRRIAAGTFANLLTSVTFVTLATRSAAAMLQRLREEQGQEQRLNATLAQRVKDSEALVAIGRLLVEGDAIEQAAGPALTVLAGAWQQPAVLFGRGDESPRPIAQVGLRAPRLVGGNDEAARVVSEDDVVTVTLTDGARTCEGRAIGIRTGTVPHGILAVVTGDDGPRPASDAGPLLQGGAALLAAAFEWQEAAGRLRAAERRRAALVKASPDAFLIVEEDGTIIDANPAAQQLLGEHSLVGRPLSGVGAIAADDLKRITRVLSDSRTGRPTSELTLTLRPGARSADVILRVIYSVDEGRGRFDVAFRDVTARAEADRQRERLEAQLYAARRLEALGQLAGGVAHDFNNLLSVILTNARLLAERQDLDQTAQDDLKEIVECGRRAADLTGQLLTFARQQRREPRVVDVNAAVRGLEKLLRRLMPTSITVTLDLVADPWPVVVDPSQLEQILVNLVANARDAMEGSGGTCTITTRNVVAPAGIVDEGGFAPDRFLELTVTDTGTGMDEETRVHVFEPFFTTKPLGRGSGLGLATVYGIVKQSGGHILVDSAPGQGATFRVYLPYAALAEDADHTPAAGGAVTMGRERVLLVDDDEAVRRATERALVSRGFTVLVARGASEALALAGEPFDAVLADLVMPEFGGDALVDRLRQARPGLPAVLLTGYGRRTVELARPFRLLRKPASPDDLARALRGVIDEGLVGRRAPPP